MIDYENDAGGEAPAADSLKRLAQLVRALRMEEMLAETLDAELAATEARARKLSEEEIPELLAECGLTELKLEDGSRVSVTAELDCGITEEARPGAMAWLKANNLDGIIKSSVIVPFGRGEYADMNDLVAKLREEGLAAAAVESVHYQTLKATMKAEREAGRNVPAELFGLRPFSKTKVTPPPGVKAPGKPRKRK